MSSWSERIILGDGNGLASPPDWLCKSYGIFARILDNPAYPCFFGIQAERRNRLFYSLVERGNLGALPGTLQTFISVIMAPPHERHNLAVFFEPDDEPRAHEYYRKKFWHILRFLRRHDPQPGVKVYDPNHPLWEFSFAGKEMFVVGASPSYQRRVSRNFGPGMVMLFQPREVFVDPVTHNVIGPGPRVLVRKRVMAWDGLSPHCDLGFYGDPQNREWKQYFLPDDEQPVSGECPLSGESGFVPGLTSCG